MERKVQRHKRGWAAVEIVRFAHLIQKTVVRVYKTKEEAEKHWDAK